MSRPTLRTSVTQNIVKNVTDMCSVSLCRSITDRSLSIWTPVLHIWRLRSWYRAAGFVRPAWRPLCRWRSAPRPPPIWAPARSDRRCLGWTWTRRSRAWASAGRRETQRSGWSQASSSGWGLCRDARLPFPRSVLSSRAEGGRTSAGDARSTRPTRGWDNLRPGRKRFKIIYIKMVYNII